MANFSPIKEQIIPVEGGYVFNKNDPGGETKYGISKRSYPALDIKNLTLDDAHDIYKRDFWDVMKLDQIDDQRIAEKVFWFGVHSGIVKSAKVLQKILKVNEDGIIGNRTLYALREFLNREEHWFDHWLLEDPALIVLNMLKLEQIQYYANIVSTKPSRREFLLGWINRALKG